MCDDIKDEYAQKCRICLTASSQMLSLFGALKENSSVTILEAIDDVMGVKEKQYLSCICGICKGLLAISYELKKQFEHSTKILKHYYKDVDAANKIDAVPNSDVPVELIIGHHKYDLKDIVIVENDNETDQTYEGFLNNLGKTVSAKIVEKDYQFRPVEEESDVIIMEQPKNIIIEEVVVKDDVDVDQYIIKTSVRPLSPKINPEKFINVISDTDITPATRFLLPKNTVHTCEYCKKVYSAKGRYLLHLRACQQLHSDEYQFMCPGCKKLFLTKDDLKEHTKNSDTNCKSYFCQKCDHIAHSSDALSYHMLKHGSKLHQCEECGMSFFRKSSLITHKHRHSQTTQVLCPVCGKSFHYKSGLAYHMKIHSNVRDYVCNYCDRKFYMLNSLKRHIRTHTGSRPFGCKFCHKKFFSRGEAAKHEMLHTGERPFRCLYCNKGFTKKFNLDVHCLSHSGAYVCQLCEKTFVEAKFLDRHVKNKHKIICESLLDVNG